MPASLRFPPPEEHVVERDGLLYSEYVPGQRCPAVGLEVATGMGRDFTCIACGASLTLPIRRHPGFVVPDRTVRVPNHADARVPAEGVSGG